MLRNRTILAVSLPLSVISSALTQESPQMQLSDLLLQVNSMSAEVQQLIVESDGAVLEESSIQMHLLRPDGFFWETLDPFYELVVTDGTLLWNYQPDLEQVVIEDWSSNKLVNWVDVGKNNSTREWKMDEVNGDKCGF